MKQLSVKACSDLLQNKQVSATELAQDYLQHIQNENAAINAFVHLDADKTLHEAKLADERLQTGMSSLLTGVPIAYKDNFCQDGWVTSCGSKMLENFVAPYTAHVVQNLRNKGMVTLGKVNMDEFAMGSNSETSHFGITRNPWNHGHVPGGSSGGSAAAVAAPAPASRPKAASRNRGLWVFMVVSRFVACGGRRFSASASRPRDGWTRGPGCGSWCRTLPPGTRRWCRPRWAGQPVSVAPTGGPQRCGIAGTASAASSPAGPGAPSRARCGRRRSLRPRARVPTAPGRAYRRCLSSSSAPCTGGPRSGH